MSDLTIMDHDQLVKEICPHCKGEKTKEIYTGFHGHTEGHQSKSIPCPLCKGEGIVFKYTMYRHIYDKLFSSVKRKS